MSNHIEALVVEAFHSNVGRERALFLEARTAIFLEARTRDHEVHEKPILVPRV